jgi:glycosyltransferase involved in cell wall biosynthesis
MEQANYGACVAAIAGSQEAASVLRRKGYQGTLGIIPQFGVDPSLFAPPEQGRPPDSFHIGYAGGLIREKGVDLLLRACAGLQGDWRLTAVGSGDEQEALMVLAQQLGIRDRVTLGQRLISQEMPNFYRSLDALVLPSRTQPNWKEQFGRVLIEAMACGVPVIGSDCGEIPNVIGQAGMIFAEEEHEQLTAQIQRLMNEPDLARSLARAGRERALERFTMSHVAQETVKLYQFLTGR